MVAPYSTQGSKHQFAVQAAFGTAATVGFKDIRVEGEPTPGNPGKSKVDVNSIFTDEHQVEKPVTFESAVDNGLQLTSLVRQPASAGGSTWHSAMFPAAGMVAGSGDDMVVQAAPAPAAGAFTTDDASTIESGYCVNVQTANYGWLPTLIAAVNTDELIPAMALPEAPATGAAVNKMVTYTPGAVGMIPGNQLLTIRSTYKAQDGGNDVMYQGQDGAVTALDDLTFTPGDTLKIGVTIGFSDLDDTTGTLGSNDFADQETGVKAFHEPICQFSNTQTTWTTALASACHTLLGITFSWGITVSQEGGFGCPADNVNNIQGWMQLYGTPMITLEMAYDPQKFDDWDGTNPSKYVSVIQPGASETDAAWGLFLPNCHIVETPTPTMYGNQEHRVSVQMIPRPAGMDGTTSSDQGNQPYYFAEADRSA